MSLPSAFDPPTSVPEESISPREAAKTLQRTITALISNAQKSSKTPEELLTELKSYPSLKTNGMFTQYGLYDASGEAWGEAQEIVSGISKNPSTLQSSAEGLKSSIRKYELLTTLKNRRIAGQSIEDYIWEEDEMRTHEVFYDLIDPTLQFRKEWPKVLSKLTDSVKLTEEEIEYLKGVHEAGKAFRADHQNF